MKYWKGIALICCLAMAIGCSGGIDYPIIPDNNAPRDSSATSMHQLLGLYQCIADPVAETLEIIPLRAVDMHLNALPFLEPPPFMNLTLESLEFNGNIIDADIGLRHPFLGLTEFSGFDVCGILISQGSVSGFNDPGLQMPGPDNLHLVNPDGYSRWWNPAEFPINTGTIFGYTDGLLGTPDSAADFSATLNGYKYFTDELNDPDDPMSLIDPTGRGIFSAGQKNVRHYTIDMGTEELIFNYAIDANWVFPDGDPPWSAPDDFPEEANRPEAWNIVITENENTLWNDGVDSGGDLSLSIDVYDWYNADLNTVYINSAGNFPAASSAVALTGSVGYSTYEIDIVDATPAETQIDLFITVECEVVDYGELLTGETQAVYFTSTAAVDDETPQTEYPPEWSCFQYNSYNMGRNPNIQDFDPLDYTQLWYTADSGLKYAGPAITETHVYICANNSFYSDSSHHITAFNISDGSVAWQYYINTTGDGGRAHTSPFYYDDGADGKVIVGGDRLYCFNALTGAIIWEYGLEYAFTRHSPKIYNDRVFSATSGGRMHCVDIDGNAIWVSDLGYAAYETVPAVRDGYIYFGGGSGNYRCMDANSSTADLIWEADHNGMTTHWNGPFISEDRLYYAAGYDERLICMNIADGSLAWSFEDPDPGTNTVWLTALGTWVDDDGKQVVCFGEAYSYGGVRAVIDQGTYGELLWEYNSGSMYVDASPVYCEGKVYVGTTTNDAVHVLDATDGSLITQISVNGDVRSAVGFAFGRMVITTSNGVYCFE